MRDIFDAVTEEKDPDGEVRRRTVPIFGPEFEWWTLAVKRQLKAKGIDQKALSSMIKAGEPEVSRCIRRAKPVYELLIAISDALKIPYPVILPESEREALHLAEQRRLIRRDIEVAEIVAGVAEIPEEDQSQPVVSEHAIRQRKRKAAGHKGRRSHRL